MEMTEHIMEYETILYEKKGEIARVTLNRPERRNAINMRLVDEMLKALHRVEEDAAIRVLIVTGGTKCFSAGIDLKEESTDERLGKVRLVFRMMEDISKPVIAAISGPCVAGGCEMMLACDLRIASETATFGLPEIRFGALAYGGATQRLPRQIPMAKAKELHLTGLPISADEALRIGLINKVVPVDALIAETENLAQTLAERPAFAVKWAKFLINTGSRMDIRTAFELEQSIAHFMRRSGEMEKGKKALAQTDETYKRIFDF